MFTRVLARWAALSGNQRGLIWVTLGMITYTLGNACVKALGSGFDDRSLLFLRGFGSALVLLVVAWRLGLRRSLGTRRPGLHLWRAVLGAAAGWAWTYATHRLSLALVTVFALSTPLWMLPLGRLMLGERLTSLRWMGVGVGFAGVWLMADPTGDVAWWPCLIAVVAALLDALLGILMKRGAESETATALVFWSIAGQAVAFGVIGGATASLPAEVSLPLLGVVVSYLVTGWLFVQGYRAGEASAVEPGAFNALPFAALLGFVQFGEIPPTIFWWGSLLLAGGMALVMFGERATAAATS